MGTRVTQSMLNQNLLYNLQRNAREMEKLQNQMSSGKKITKPSDDPVTAVRSMFYHSTLNEIEQFKSNIDEGISWMTTADESLADINSVLQRVRELTLQGLNGTNGESEREAIAKEIEQLKEHIGQVANSQIGGRYIFAGTDVKTPPYRENPLTSEKGFVNENNAKIEVQVGPSNSVQINIPGTEIFNKSGTDGMFKVLDDIVTAFRTGDVTGDFLDKLDVQIENVLVNRSEIGARMNRLELSQGRIEQLEFSTTSLLTNEEYVDITRVVIDVKSQESVYQAALSIGAKVIQASLVDFLR
jgi:flagellar hook-associated protein 3 FlgL